MFTTYPHNLSKCRQKVQCLNLQIKSLCLPIQVMLNDTLDRERSLSDGSVSGGLENKHSNERWMNRHCWRTVREQLLWGTSVCISFVCDHNADDLIHFAEDQTMPKDHYWSKSVTVPFHNYFCIQVILSFHCLKYNPQNFHYSLYLCLHVHNMTALYRGNVTEQCVTSSWTDNVGNFC